MLELFSVVDRGDELSVDSDLDLSSTSYSDVERRDFRRRRCPELPGLFLLLGADLTVLAVEQLAEEPNRGKGLSRTAERERQVECSRWVPVKLERRTKELSRFDIPRPVEGSGPQLEELSSTAFLRL
jgi:hypothetical protein